MRQRFKDLVNDIRRSQHPSRSQSSKNSRSNAHKLEFDEKRLQRLSFLSSDNNEEFVSSYNLQKYES